jgi:hypothetical protein
MRSIEDIATTGAAWVTEAELAMLCAFAKRAEASEAEVERLRKEREALLNGLALMTDGRDGAEARVRTLVAAGDRLDDAITSRNIHKAILDDWAEAKRKAGL